jgi:hypothetical protein
VGVRAPPVQHVRRPGSRCTGTAAAPPPPPPPKAPRPPGPTPGPEASAAHPTCQVGVLEDLQRGPGLDQLLGHGPLAQLLEAGHRAARPRAQRQLRHLADAPGRLLVPAGLVRAAGQAVGCSRVGAAGGAAAPVTRRVAQRPLHLLPAALALAAAQAAAAAVLAAAVAAMAAAAAVVARGRVNLRHMGRAGAWQGRVGERQAWLAEWGVGGQGGEGASKGRCGAAGAEHS